MTIFVMKTFIRNGNYLLLVLESRPSHPSLLNGKNDSFTKNDWQEKHIVYLVDFFQFLPGVNCVSGALMIVPSQTKFVKSRQTIRICWASWWQKICLIKQRFNYADRPYSRKNRQKCYGEKSLIKLIWYLLHNSTGAFCVWVHALSYYFRTCRELT